MKIFKVLTALLFSLVMGGIFAIAGFLLKSSPVIFGIVGVALSLIPTKSGIVGFKIGTLTTGVGIVSTIDLQFVPEKLFYVAATQLTGLKLEVHGEGVISDLDAKGLSALGVHRIVGKVTNGYMIPLADGIIPGKNAKLTFINSAAQTPDIYALGNNTGTAFIRCNKATVLLNNNTDFANFAALFLPDVANGDKLTILYEDTTSHIWEKAELEAESGTFQSTPSPLIDNLDFSIKKANILVAATQTIFVLDFKRPT